MDVNIILGRFQPFTQGHLKCVEEARKTKGVPTVVCMIETPDYKVDKKKPFPSSVLLPMYKDLFGVHKDIVDIIVVKSADIVKIQEALGDSYKVVSWSCGTDRYKDYKRMADKYAPDIEVLEIKRGDDDISATKVREAILSGDNKTYTQLSIDPSEKYIGELYRLLKSVNESNYISLQQFIMESLLGKG